MYRNCADDMLDKDDMRAIWVKTQHDYVADCPVIVKQTADFVYWQSGEEIYHCPAGTSAPLSDTGMPGNCRWECSIEQFNRFKSILA